MSTPNTPIQPQNINTNKHFFSAFSHNETELSANWLVSFAQERKQGWAPFMYSEIEKFYNKASKGKLKDFRFNRLISHGHITQDQKDTDQKHDDCNYHFTVGFVSSCYKSSPAP